jgi:hypothetical protein
MFEEVTRANADLEVVGRNLRTVEIDEFFSRAMPETSVGKAEDPPVVEGEIPLRVDRMGAFHV